MTPPRGDAELGRLLVGQILRHESQPAAYHVAVRQDLLHDAAHQIDGNGKADAFGSPVGAVQHGGIDADQIAVGVDERAAGIAEIDGGIGLDEILEGGEAKLAAAGGADDALRHGLAQAVGIADGQHDIAHPQRVGAAQRHDRQIADRQGENGEIGVRILSDDRRLGDAPVGQLHPDGIGARDHVLIGDDGALRIDDHAGPQAALDVLAVTRPVIAEQLIERRRLAALGDDARGINVHHRRRRARHRSRQSSACHGGARARQPVPASRAGALTAPNSAGFHQTTRKAPARPTTAARSKKLARMRVFCKSTPSRVT